MKRFLALITAALMLLPLTGCGAPETELDPDEPVVLSMWHVYGEQADSPMNRLVAEFNETVGLEKGILIDVSVMSNSAHIGDKLLAAQADRPGEPAMPDLFFCHASNAAALGTENLLDWSTRFSAEELADYVPEFLDEGRVDGHLVLFPVSKSTHLIFMNGTQFARFSADTGVTADSLATWDGFFDAAEQYYNWSGGRAFCAMDYLLRAGELSLLSDGGSIPWQGSWYDTGDPALKEAFLPFARSLVQGHIAVSDLYANTQVMTGEALSGLGSSAAILYYNDTVTYPDNTTEPMNLMVLPMPQGKSPVITQAGVGLAAYKTTEKKAEAATVFAKWLTEPHRNLDFVTETGYMPVHRGAFELIAEYPFSDPAREALFSTLQKVRASSVSVTEPTDSGYYKNAGAFYDKLREQAPLWAASSASPDLLAEEVWEIFSSFH